MIDRRTFLRSTAGAVTLGGMSIMAAPSTAALLHPEKADPILSFLDQWQAAIDSYVAMQGPGTDAYWNAAVAPFEDRACLGEIPNATTAKGAAAALRKALSFDDIEDQDANLIRSALAFLDTRVGQ